MAGKVDRFWADYEDHHRSGGNKYCHMAGIPLIIFGLLGLLGIPLFRLGLLTVDVALLVVVVMGCAYLALDFKLGVGMFAALFVLYVAAHLLHWPLALGLFIAGWALQAIGHGIYERRAPAFLDNLIHLLIGPLWVLNNLLHIRKASGATTTGPGN